MSALYNDQFAFVHVPKTGGTWAMQAMKRAGISYTEVGEGPAAHVPYTELPDRFRFGFVRHPVTWYASWWAFFQRDDVPPQGPFERATKELSFPDFVEWMTQKHPGFMTGFYSGYVGPPEDEIDFIGRQEKMADDLASALDLAGVEFDRTALVSLPPANESKNRPEITLELSVKICRSEHAAIERFGYTREPAIR